jgi:hypothetical protein
MVRGGLSVDLPPASPIEFRDDLYIKELAVAVAVESCSWSFRHRHAIQHQVDFDHGPKR